MIADSSESDSNEGRAIVATSWAWPALRVLAEGRVASLYLDLFCCNGVNVQVGPIITQLAANVR